MRTCSRREQRPRHRAGPRAGGRRGPSRAREDCLAARRESPSRRGQSDEAASGARLRATSALHGPPTRSWLCVEDFAVRRLPTPGAMPVTRGLRWMMVAQACFAWMNVWTRLVAAICRGPRSPRCGSPRRGAAAGLAAATVGLSALSTAPEPGGAASSAPSRPWELLRARLDPRGDRRCRDARRDQPIFVALLSRPLLGERWVVMWR